MNVEALLSRAIETRRAAGLSLTAYGAEGYTADQPFTCHAKDAAQVEAWRAKLEAKGFMITAQ